MSIFGNTPAGLNFRGMAVPSSSAPGPGRLDAPPPIGNTGTSGPTGRGVSDQHALRGGIMGDSSTGRRARPGAATPAAVGLMATIAAVAGCGRAPEATRFVPAAPPDPERPASAPDRARPEVRKIEMH